MSVRVRFAPSPTGFMHLGGLRTAFYNYLFARKHKGQFILRIEDTDTERSVPEHTTAILTTLHWFQLIYDQGPFYQSNHLKRYHAVLVELLNSGKAYRCYCSRERLDQLREKQIKQKQKPKYDGHCRDRKDEPDQPYVVRFRNPLRGPVVVEDKTYGHVTFHNEELDDFILARSDGSPTYNFTVVVDDWDMGITHVIRGEDHLNNTPRQINLLNALGAPLPVYAHIPMILDQDGKKLSKRSGAANALDYCKEGYLPEAVLNYLVRLGWSHGDQEIFTREEMIQYFDLDALNKSPTSINPKKLIWLNQYYLKKQHPNYIAPYFAEILQECGVDTTQGPALADVVLAQRDRVKTLLEMAKKSLCFYQDVAGDYTHVPDEIVPALQRLNQYLTQLDDWQWTSETINDALLQVLVDFKLKLNQLAQPLRWIMTGSNVSPSIEKTLYLIGRGRVLKRLQYFN
jgi:glutamyl-tRNA synthetase